MTGNVARSPEPASGASALPPEPAGLTAKATAEVVTEVRDALRSLQAEVDLHAKHVAEQIARVDHELSRLEAPRAVSTADGHARVERGDS